jgi:DNA-binding CsgD family transcriptional regulator
MEAHESTGVPVPLAGREQELQLLWRALEQVAADGLRVVLVAGEPGIGKTRLLHALAAGATARGMPILRGGAVAAEGMPPYLPFLEAFGRYIAQADPDLLRSQVGDAGTLLALLFPELATRLGPQPERYPLPAEQSRLRLYDAIGRFLSAIGGPNALLLLLDDLHWADPTTLDLLAHLARQIGSSAAPTPLLIVGTYRPGEIAQPVAFERTIVELNRLRCLSILPLGSLDESAIGQLAVGMLGSKLAPATRRLLWMHSEGNPFFAEELLRGWLDTGALVSQEAGWSIVGPADPRLPASISMAVRSRLARLDPELIDLLRVAAVIGRSCPLALLAQVAEQDLETIEDALRTAAQAQLVRLDNSELCRFTHDKIRETLYDELPASRRRRLHSQVGHMLAQLEAEPDPQHLANLAFHFARAGDRERGIAYALQAAAGALGAAAAEVALGHYQVAIELSSPSDLRWGEILLGAGMAAAAAGQEHSALERFGSARVWFAEHGNVEQAAQAAIQRGHAAWRLEDLAGARAAFEDACALLSGRPGPLLAQALLDLGNLLAMSLHQQAAGMEACQRALALAYDFEEQRLVAAASRALGNTLVRGGDLPGGIALLDRALALAEAADDLVEASECGVLLAHACYWQGDLLRTFALGDQVVAFARRTRDPYQLRHIYALQAQGALMQGHWAAAEQWLAAAQREVETLASPEPRAFAHTIRGNLAYERGEGALAEQHYATAIAAFRSFGPQALPWYLGQYGLAQLAAGQRQAAQQTMLELAALLNELPQGAIPTATVQCMLALVALELGDMPRAVALAPHISPFRGHFLDVLVDRVLGQIAIAQRDWDTAHAALAAAEAAARRNHLLPELGRVISAQAELAQARERNPAGAEAARLRAAALAIYEQLGNQQAVARLRSQPQANSMARPATPTFPAGLSAREVEVLRLVAAGKSNRAIAQALIISEKTVANHLANIFAKTGAGNRAAATAFAIRHGLA